MTENLLPESVKSKASVHLGEWAWKGADVFPAIEAAAGLKLAVVLGDPRLTLPHGVYEFAVDTAGEEEMRRDDESWPAFVERSAAEATRTLRRLLAERSWLDGQEFVPKDVGDVEWVLYFVEEPTA